jgi:hypothetical protein
MREQAPDLVRERVEELPHRLPALALEERVTAAAWSTDGVGMSRVTHGSRSSDPGLFSQ